MCLTFKHLQCLTELFQVALFLCRYKQEFGFVIPGWKILVDDVRVRSIGRTHVHMQHTVSRASGELITDMVSEAINFSKLMMLPLLLEL